MKLTISQEGANPITIRNYNSKKIRSNESGTIGAPSWLIEGAQTLAKNYNTIYGAMVKSSSYSAVNSMNKQELCDAIIKTDYADIDKLIDYFISSKNDVINSLNRANSMLDEEMSGFDNPKNIFRKDKATWRDVYGKRFDEIFMGNLKQDYVISGSDFDSVFRGLAVKLDTFIEALKECKNIIANNKSKTEQQYLYGTNNNGSDSSLQQGINDKLQQQRVGAGLTAGAVGAAGLVAYLLAGTIYDKVTSIGYFNSGNDMLSSPKLLSNIERAKSKFSRPATAAEVKSSPIAKSKTTFLSKILGRGTNMNIINKIGTMGLLVKDVNGVAVSVATLNGSEKASKSNKVIIATAYGYNSQGKFISVPLARGFLNAGNVVNASRESVNAITVSHNGKVIYKTK